MSFHFSGAGAPADVARQIRSHHVDGGAGHDLRELIIGMLEEDNSDGYVYAVEATGHSAPGGAATLEVKVRAFYAPAGWRTHGLAEVDKLAHAAAELAKANPDLFRSVAAAAAQQLAAGGPDVLGLAVDGVMPIANANGVDLGIGLPAAGSVEVDLDG